MKDNANDLDIFADMRDKYIKIHLQWINGDLYLRHTGCYKYDFIFEYIDDDGQIFCYDNKNVNLDYITFIIHTYTLNSELYSSFYWYMIEDNELYEALIAEAIRLKDDLLRVQLKIANATEDLADCKRLSELIGGRVLYRLSNKYDKEYIVKSEGIDKQVLINSGYGIHPVDVQYNDGWTKELWSLNPFQKRAFDASKINEMSITFEEYLNMFDESQIMKRGVFWLIDGELKCYPFDGSFPEGIAKSGNTYNHKKLWDYIRPKGCNKAFDYFPRGRVEISSKGKAIVYMSPYIANDHISQICKEFEINETPVVKYDHSEHYHCYLDKEK